MACILTFMPHTYNFWRLVCVLNKKLKPCIIILPWCYLCHKCCWFLLLCSCRCLLELCVPLKTFQVSSYYFFNCESGVNITTLGLAFALKSIIRSIHVDVQIIMFIHTFQSCPSLGTTNLNININELKYYILVCHLAKKRKVEYIWSKEIVRTHGQPHSFGLNMS
jgi:hypothetical protein